MTNCDCGFLEGKRGDCICNKRYSSTEKEIKMPFEHLLNKDNYTKQEVSEILRATYEGMSNGFIKGKFALLKKLEKLKEKNTKNNCSNEQLLQDDEGSSRVSEDSIFIKHIQDHLLGGEKVICKICGKTAEQIMGENK